MIKKYGFLLGLFSLVLAFTPSILAQRPYRVNDQQVQNLVQRIQTRSDAFRSSLDASLDRGRLDGTRAEDNINEFVKNFETATNNLRDRVNNRQAASSDVSEVLNRAAAIDRFVKSHRLNANAQRDWNYLRTDLSTLASYYNVSWDWNNPPAAYPPTTGGGTAYYNTLTGTYRLDTSRSEDTQRIIDRETRNLPSNSADRIRNQLSRRLTAPEMLALERTGTNVVMASTNSSQTTVVADGRANYDTNSRGREGRTTATLRGETLTINSDNNVNNSNNYYITFEPIDNGARLRMTRRVYIEGLNNPVTAYSIYERTDNSARFNDVYSGNNNAGYNNGGNGGTYNGNGSTGANSSNDFIIPNNTQIAGTLNQDLNTSTAREGDRFTLNITSPNQYRNAVIEGRVVNADRSGRVSGRAQLTLDFDTIRMPNGQSYRFAGLLESVKLPNGDIVRVDNEGAARDNTNQTTRTATRAGVGAAVGALIGAIAGGGSGAAIGAGVGAGVGAGSVLAQGREDLQLPSGTEVMVRASSSLR